MTYFNENAVVGSVDRPSGSGGALFVDHGGAVVFGDASVFTNNDVGGGGQGGAVANLGSLVFEGPSGQAMFSNNAAPGDFGTMSFLLSKFCALVAAFGR